MPVDQYITDLRAANPGPTSADAAEACERAVEAMHLVHSLKNFKLFKEPTPELRSPVRRGREPSDVRQFAGTQDAVFFYVGPAMQTRDRAGALVFRADVEEGGVATPWDSGGLCSLRAQHLGEAERRDLLRRRTMPAPDYRRALAVTLLLRFGGEPARYLRSELPGGVDPDGVSDEDAASYTYEARLPGSVAIKTPALALVVVHEQFSRLPGVHDLRTWCRDNRIPFELIEDESRSVPSVVRDFALRRIA